MVVLGIDVGIHGMLCFINEKQEIEILPNPVIGNQIDAIEFSYILTRFSPDKVFMERPQVRPMQGIKSALTTGINFGIMLSTVQLAKIPLVTLDPKTWQKVCFIGIETDLEPKVKSAMAAQRLFPGVDFRDTPRCKKPNDNKTDASLIAYFGLISSLGKGTP